MGFWLYRVVASIHRLLTAASSALRRLGLAAYTVHRRDPGYPLTAALSDDDSWLRARALRVVGQLGRVALLPLLQHNLTVDDGLCRFSAAWSAALLGDMGAIPTLQAMASFDHLYREEAVKMALRRMDLTAAHAWRQALAHKPDTM